MADVERLAPVDESNRSDSDQSFISRHWASKKKWVGEHPIIAVALVMVLIAFIWMIVAWATSSESFSQPFNQHGTPDWKIRNKGHRHVKRSDSHVMTSNATKSGKKWSIDSMKKQVADINKRAN